MDTKLVQTLRNYLATQPVTKAWVFGSFSRGEQTPQSDLDLMVALDPHRSIGLSFFRMYAELKELLGREVDLVTEGSLLPWVSDSADKDKILIYERSN